MRPSDEPALEAVAQAYDRLARPLFRYAVMILASHSDAEDVVQRVFMTVLGQLQTIESIDSMDGYLRRAVRNECFSLLRHKRVRATEHMDGPLIEAIVPQVDRIDERLAIEQALVALSPQQREVVQLKAFEGLTFDAIASISGESINTVAGRYRYALKAMRKALGAGARP